MTSQFSFVLPFGEESLSDIRSIITGEGGAEYVTSIRIASDDEDVDEDDDEEYNVSFARVGRGTRGSIISVSGLLNSSTRSIKS